MMGASQANGLSQQAAEPEVSALRASIRHYVANAPTRGQTPAPVVADAIVWEARLAAIAALD
jgi:hypothetical protein